MANKFTSSLAVVFACLLIIGGVFGYIGLKEKLVSKSEAIDISEITPENCKENTHIRGTVSYCLGPYGESYWQADNSNTKTRVTDYYLIPASENHMISIVISDKSTISKLDMIAKATESLLIKDYDHYEAYSASVSDYKFDGKITKIDNGIQKYLYEYLDSPNNTMSKEEINEAFLTEYQLVPFDDESKISTYFKFALGFGGAGLIGLLFVLLDYLKERRKIAQMYKTRAELQGNYNNSSDYNQPQYNSPSSTMQPTMQTITHQDEVKKEEPNESPVMPSLSYKKPDENLENDNENTNNNM